MEMAWLRVAETAPAILLGLLAGVAVDRWRRRQTLLMTDLARAALVGCIPALFLLHHLTVPIITGIAVLLSVATVTFDSAYDAYLPTLIATDEVVDANAKMSAIGSVAEVAGFGVSGALFAWLGGALTLSIDALSFVVSAVSLALIRGREPEPASSPAPEPVLGALWAGLRYLFGHPALSRMAVMETGQSLFLGVTGAVYMLYLSRVLLLPPLVQGVLYAVGGIASFAAAGLGPRFLRHLGYARSLLLRTVAGAAGALLVPMAFGPVAAVMAFVLGQQLLADSGDTVFDVTLSSLRQQIADNAILGRIRSIGLVVTGIGTLTGALLGGQLAGVIGLRDVLWLAVAIRLAVFGVTAVAGGHLTTAAQAPPAAATGSLS
jgi:hypothetical protein